MRFFPPSLTGAVTVFLAASALHAQDQRPAPTAVWAPRPIRTPAYTPPQKPWVTLADLKARHIEGQQPFVASEGDIVYAPANPWHATRVYGPEPACRLSITESVGKTLLLEPRAERR